MEDAMIIANASRVVDCESSSASQVESSAERRLG